MTAPESTSALLLELSPNAAMLKRLPKTRWSQPCPCSLSCPVLWEAEAAAIGIAARRRQLWRVIHPRLACSARMASGGDIPAPRADGLSLDAAADLCGHLGVRPDPSVPGLPVPESSRFGFGKFAPMAQRIAVGECWRDCPKQCP